MRFVSLDDGQMYPQASPSGDQGNMLDTGWDVLWPGPARVYLSEADIHDVLCADGVLDLAQVVEALTAHGWVPPAAVAEMGEAFSAELDQATAEVAAARAEADGLLLALRRAAPEEIADREFELVPVGAVGAPAFQNGWANVQSDTGGGD